MRRFILPVLFFAAFSAPVAYAKNITLFAAASTAQVMNELRVRWNADGNTELRIVYGSSGALARQIENGAPASLYFSANRAWVDYLVKLKLARSETRKTLFRNRMVLIAPALAQLPNPFSVARDIGPALGNSGRIAIGDPQHVPAGIYGRQALGSLGLWSAFAHRTVRARDVRLALALVQRGETPLGIVYYTDAIQSGQVRIVATFDGALHAPIEYQLVATRSANKAAIKLLNYLASDANGAVYRKFGFLPR